MKDLVIKKPILPDEKKKKKKKLASKKQTKRKVDAVKKRAKKKQKGPVVDPSVYVPPASAEDEVFTRVEMDRRQ
ncbi:hypothetical protein BBP00_00009560 [Phytophthora kernoviae]|uniref:Uncharacterized protein n=1 Tax=Phytophthora kernoviae TaxID=325452 RepID=A0A3F2RC90_9STRA|nr:hypothetical protein BBP00_00009560 [Phytophthora kernoviae]